MTNLKCACCGVICMIFIYELELAGASAAVSQAQNGDIRLSDGTSIKGRVEVYLDGSWGTVCYDPVKYTVWEQGAARAACRQLGYDDLVNVDTVVEVGIPEASSNTPIHLYELNCPYKKDTNLNNVAEHILRCTYDHHGNCTHSQDMAIECSSTSKYTNPYNTAVRIVKPEGETGFPSSGAVEVYLNDRWGTMCYMNSSRVNLHAAVSVCRQMGYTGATSYTPIEQGTISDVLSWVNSINCGGSSQACVISCFSYPSTSAIGAVCETGSILAVTCTFDTDSDMSAGDEQLCTAAIVNRNRLIKTAIIVGAVVLGIVMLTLLIIIIVLCCCFIPNCPLHSYRERRFYENIN